MYYIYFNLASFLHTTVGGWVALERTFSIPDSQLVSSEYRATGGKKKPINLLRKTWV